MTTYTGFVIERKTNGPDWEPFAFPRNDIDEAKRTLSVLREAEEKKRFKRPPRLVRETREYIDT